MENSNLSDSQVLDSSFSHSPSSEPLDIRNWFSSYVYESPELDSNDNFGDSISREREIGVEKDEQIAGEENGGIGENIGESRDVTKIDEEEAAEKLPGAWISLKCTSLKDHRESQPLGMNQDSWCSQSLLSEPPDVGKWFSSYVYESPTLNLSQEFGYCESGKTGLDHEMEETQENVRKTKNGGEIVELNLFEKCNGNSRGNRLNNRPLSEQNLFSDKTWEKDPKEKSVGTNEISSTKDSQCKLQERVSQENGSVPLHINRSSNDENKKPTTHTNSIHKIDLILESSENDEQSIREPIVVSNNKGNKEKGVSDDGFITARKREFSEETCKKSVEKQENYKDKEVGSGFGCLRRKALRDKTNYEHSDMVEIIGKWSCPQKSKPSRGPPLKQLRLERWVHKK
ncbi:uncharacterized protein LOC111809611 isoform X1 [Cucurbita pepo subsp. pepo]|uniref:uncharacterized protein LOC111809611 isoform X1 n=1 Tax=Cucurbita pepo subsp. pepo TaxID=3664 RepID=UPI000C9D2C24|nr:uncharacterized protein LOC111809611 isoform X1 [Cucurbita pepo subsp. pepo]